MMRLQGARGVALLIGGCYCLTRGIAYLPVIGEPPPEPLPEGLQLISAVLPIAFWAGLWVLVGIVCWIKAFFVNDSLAWGLLTGIMTAWGTAYALGWIGSLVHGSSNREWLSAVTYTGPAMIIAILSVRRAHRVHAGESDA